MDDIEKTKVGVCFTIEESYVQHLCVAISSMLKNNKDVSFSVYIFSFGLSNRLKASIKSVLKNHNNFNLSFVDAEVSLVKDFKVSLHASGVNYLRLFIAGMLPQLNKILYLDCDLIVRSSLVELYEKDVSEFMFAAVPQKNLERSGVLGIGEEDYFNSGVLLLNLEKWRAENASHVLREFILRHPTKIHYWDQDALNAVYHSHYLKLDEKWNFVKTNSAASDLDALDVRIIHFAGMHKPWSPYSTHSLNEEYYKYLKSVKLPGIKLSELRSTINALLSLVAKQLHLN